jgi:hypothetical protein
MRKVRIVKLLGAGNLVALAGALVLASGVLTPSPGEADPGKSAAASDQQVRRAVRQTTTFGTLGIVDGQTVRLSAVRAPDDDPAALCKVDLNFFDARGDRQGAGVSADLQPRQAAFFDLSRADIHQEAGEARAQIYAVVDVTSDVKKGDEPTCDAAMSIEIFDQLDGRTQIYQGVSRSTIRVLNCCDICCRVDFAGNCAFTCGNCVPPPAIPTCPFCTIFGGCSVGGRF